MGYQGDGLYEFDAGLLENENGLLRTKFPIRFYS